jgi:WD40 repeat protein
MSSAACATIEPLRHNSILKAVAFSPDGRTVVTGADDGAARLWRVPQLPENPDLISNWAAVKPGIALNSQGLPRVLSQAECLKAREELERLRGDVNLP